MKNIRFSLFLLMLLFAGIAKATDYYVSTSGNNSNNGTSQNTPWQTLGKVQTVCNNGTIKAGDNIFFKKGDIFTGTFLMAAIWGNSANSGTPDKPITFSAYGTGAKPIFQYPQGTSIPVSERAVMFFEGVNYIVIDGFNFTDLVDPTNDKITPANAGFAIYFGIGDEATANHCTVKNTDVSLYGMGIAIVGDFNTVTGSTFTNFKNLISTNGGDDDFGANAITIDGSDNQIINNYIAGAWAYSSDFGWNGGACEMFNNCNRNKIMYNTIVDCDGISEYGGDGGTTAADNLIAYNKVINCGQLTWVNTIGTFAMQASNIQYYNNVIVENNLSRFSGPNTGADNPHPLAQYPQTEMFGYSGTPAASVVLNLKNNIFLLSTGIDITKSSYAAKILHQDNIYELTNSSVTNFGLAASELSTSVAILTNTSSPDPLAWNYTPIAGSPAIDFGQDLGLTRDFAGNIVPSTPNAGILETAAAGSVTLVATSSAPAINCNAGTTTVTVTATGGTAPYTGTGTFVVGAGTYNYTVTDAAGTVTTTAITITQPTAIAVTATAGTIAVFGGSTSVTIIASGGTSPYSYSIDGGVFQALNIFTNIIAGSHTIIVKDAKSCTAVKSITIAQPVAPNQLVVASAAGSINCNGGTTIVTVTATGGSAPYTGTGNFTVGAGTHAYTVTDAAGTTRTTFITIAQPAAIIVSATAGAIAVFGGSTSVTVTASGGITPYSYSINGINFQTSNTFAGVSAGDKTITVKDAKGCTSVKSLTITQPEALTAASTQGVINCNRGTTIVTISATGGIAPYTGTGNYTVSAGTYAYTVKDANGSTKNISVTVSQPTAISASILAPGVYSSTAKTTATVTASGGTPGYTFSLDGGNYQSSNRFSNIAAGNHSIRIKDTKGCIYSKSFTVSVIPVAPLSLSSVAGTINCNGGTTTVTINASGGVPPYTGTGAYTVSAGSRTYTVTDATGTAVTKSITIAQPAPITIRVTTGTIATHGGTTTATIAATGGTGTYAYKLNAGNYQSSNRFSAITAGNYTITVKDTRNCTSAQSFTVTQPQAAFKLVLVSKTDVTCRNRNDGTIQVTGSGGTLPYTYKKNNGSYSPNNIFTNLGAGSYTIKGKDATGAVSSITVSISGSQANCSRSKNSFGKNDETADPESNDQASIEGLKITAFPNPSSNQFSLVAENGSAENIYITVMNMNGQKLYETNSTVHKKVVFGGSFVSGIYFLKVVQGKKAEVIKLIKTN